MCGRYKLDVTSVDLGRMLEGDMSVEWNPLWNIKPTQRVPAFYETVTDDGEITRTLVTPTRGPNHLQGMSFETDRLCDTGIYTAACRRARWVRIDEGIVTFS